MSEPQGFRTLRGFIDGEEPQEPNYFAFSASLRIHGHGVPFEEITKELGVKPTHVHRVGERPGPSSPPYRDDAWQFQTTVPETAPLAVHLQSLWDILRPHLPYLKRLKQAYQVDVFCGYRSSCDCAGFEVPHTCLEMFSALEVPFGISVIIA